MTVTAIKSKKEFDELVASGKLIFVDFWAEWCGPCRIISPEFENLAKQHTREGVAEFYKVNIDDLPEIAAELSIRSIPTFHVFQNGQRLDTVIGANRGALATFVQTGVARV